MVRAFRVRSRRSDCRSVQLALRSGNEIASPDSDKFLLAALKAQWDLGPVQLFSNTSYFKRDQAATTDYSQFDRGIFLGNPYPPVAGGLRILGGRAAELDAGAARAVE